MSARSVLTSVEKLRFPKPKPMFIYFTQCQHCDTNFGRSSPGTQEKPHGMPSAPGGGMLFVIGIVATTAGTLAAILRALNRAPEGYEDELGFHIVKRAKGSAILARRQSAATAASLRSV